MFHVKHCGAFFIIVVYMRLLFARKGSNYFVYPVRHGYEVVPAEALRGHRGSAYAHAGGLHGAAFFSGTLFLFSVMARLSSAC